MKTLLRRPFFVLGLLMLAAGLAAGCSAGRQGEGRVHVLTWHGDVNPVMARYIERGIGTAERSDAAAVVLRLDTPGGLDSAMRDIVKRIENARVPVLVYVSPAGSRAASAGTFITMAGHVAAMAPNTAIGAATPINSSGEDIEGALGRKVTNDAVAYIRGIAELRGRNADWAEQAVREAVSINENQAVSLSVVDMVATSVEGLLAKADGRSVQVYSDAGALETRALRVAGVPTHNNGPNLAEQFLDVVATPDIAFLLLTIGSLFILFEVFNPSIVGGVIGAICLLVAFFALGALPTNWAGVALILLAFVLFAAELFVSGFGVLGIGAIIAFILGGLILTGSSDTGFQVSRWLVIGAGAVVGAFALLLIGALVKSRNMPPHGGTQGLAGTQGFARTKLDPNGYVSVRGERWEAVAEDPPLYEGDAVIVTGAIGLRLKVKRDPASIKLLPPPEEASPPATSARV